jgi:hypothetical protein
MQTRLHARDIGLSRTQFATSRKPPGANPASLGPNENGLDRLHIPKYPMGKRVDWGMLLRPSDQ